MPLLALTSTSGFTLVSVRAVIMTAASYARSSPPPNGVRARAAAGGMQCMQS